MLFRSLINFQRSAESLFIVIIRMSTQLTVLRPGEAAKTYSLTPKGMVLLKMGIEDHRLQARMVHGCCQSFEICLRRYVMK